MGPHPVVTTAVQAQLDRSEAQMRDAGVVAILRAKNADVAIQRGIELVSMGCKAIEVTWDSAEKERILPALVAAVGDRCLVGVGTVEHVSQVELCAKLGARFALSPINPPGMIEACHSRGVLAVPAAFSPQEIHDAWAQGARAIKVFPAQLWSPALLKAVRGIGSFGQIALCPSGGITPANCVEWLEAGAVLVGMGSNLAGKDIGVPPGQQHANAMAEAKRKWAQGGKAAAAKVFADVDAHLQKAGRAKL